jgi:hypothetical protein
MALGAFLIGSRCRAVDAEGRLVIEVDAEHAFFKANLESADNRRFIEGVIREVFGRTYHYVVSVGGGERGREEVRIPEPAARSTSREGGAEEALDSERAVPRRAPSTLEAGPAPRPAGGSEPVSGKSPLEIAGTDENVQRIMELFDGEITS